MTLARRGFLTGLGAALIASPAIVRASSLMAIKPIAAPLEGYWHTSYWGDVSMRWSSRLVYIGSDGDFVGFGAP